MFMLEKVREKGREIHALAQRHNAERLWVFGSCARREERPDSDIDFLVKFSGPVGFDLMVFERELSELLGRRAQVTFNTVLLKEPRFAARVCKEAVEI